MSLKSILSAIVHFPEEAVKAIGDLFNAATKAWEKLSPEIQQALTQGSGVIAVINSMLNSPVADVITAITGKFGIDESVLQSWLTKAGNYLQVGENLNSANLPTLIANFQAFFKSQNATEWQKISSIAAQFIADIAAPESTPFSIIVSFIETAYQEVVKPLLAK